MHCNVGGCAFLYMCALPPPKNKKHTFQKKRNPARPSIHLSGCRSSWVPPHFCWAVWCWWRHQRRRPSPAQCHWGSSQPSRCRRRSLPHGCPGARHTAARRGAMASEPVAGSAGEPGRFQGGASWCWMMFDDDWYPFLMVYAMIGCQYSLVSFKFNDDQ